MSTPTPTTEWSRSPTVTSNDVKEASLHEKGSTEGAAGSNPLADLSPARKNVLLLCFCLAMFIDAAGVSATFLMTAPIAEDLHISFANEAWILGTYSMVFAACLLFAGRLADLYSPRIIYIVGFAGIAIFYLIISFMTNDIAFYVLRALSAFLAVLTIPSSINQIIQMYPEPEEQAKALGLFGMAGALANTLALLLAGVFLLADWRWYFRFIAILTAPFAVLAFFILPSTKAVASDLGGFDKWKRMDLPGVGFMVASLILFVYGFTQAPMVGWNSATFIAPFVVSVVLAAGFIIYERFLPVGYSLLPHAIWSYPNIFPLMLQASAVFMWMATAQLRLATYFQSANGDSPIIAAVRLLPMGVTALIVGVFTQIFPKLITRPRYIQPIASILCFAGSMLFAFSNGGRGNDYWRYLFPGQVIGTAGAMIVFIGCNTLIIQSFPLEFAGIGGSFANVIFQIGGVIGIAVQAGLIATGDGTVEDWIGSRNGYFFTSGYILFTGLVFVLWYRQSKMPVREGVVTV